MKKIIGFIVVIIVVIGIGLYFYMYKGHRDIASENADYTLSLVQLQKEFAQNDSLCIKKYQDHTIQIYGKTTSIDSSGHTIVIDEKISAEFQDSILPKLTLQKPIKIKARFLGYDDLLEEFKFDQASIAE